jgi:hypothetical protein
VGQPSEQPTWSQEEWAALRAFRQAFNQELLDSGELVETRGLSAPVHTRRIQLKEGVPVVTDGPYDNPVVALNHAVAVSMVAGPRAGLELVQRLGADARINTDRRFHAVRGHLLKMADDPAAALEAYQAAARAATNLQQQRYLNQQINRLQAPPESAR